jgi:hypothetical protein
MGLGKTLTVISLILKQIQYEEENDVEESNSDAEERDEGWLPCIALKAVGRRDQDKTKAQRLKY